MPSKSTDWAPGPPPGSDRAEQIEMLAASPPTLLALVNLRRIFPIVLFTGVASLAVQHTVDPDMWWHLRTGELIVSSGIPRQDVFSYTASANEWVAHEWLSQVVMWLTYRAGGLVALMILFAVIVTATFAIVYRMSPGKPNIASLATLVAAGGTAAVWGVRVQLVNLLLLAVFLLLLERRKDGSIGGWVWFAFPALTLLWVNLHSGYLLGVAALGAYLAGELIELKTTHHDPRTLPARDVARLGASIASCLGAALVNPNGARMLVYPFETLGSTVQRRFITEWHPPSPDQPVFWLLVLLVLFGIGGMLRSPARPSATELLMFAGTAVGAALSARNVPIFAVVAGPILARHWSAALGFVERERPRGRLDRQTALAATAIAALGIAVAATTIASNDEAVDASLPVAAVDWLDDRSGSGRVFNAYGWGGYLIWRGYPVFIDGRADVYRDQGLLDFAAIYYAADGWQGKLDAAAVDYVLVERGSTLGQVLRGDPGWQTAYEDRIATVFTRPGS